MKKIYLISLFIFGLSCSLMGQNAATTESQNYEWTMLKEQSGLKISYSAKICDEENYIFWKVENTTSETQIISIVSDITNVKASSAYTIATNAGEVLMGSCELSSQKNSPLIWQMAPDAFKPEIIQVIIH